MTVKIAEIRVAKRIRREIRGVRELAENIRAHGLLNPVTVMKTADGYQLLAGLRRLRAASSLGWDDVAVNVVLPKDAEEVLRIEISENEQREPFSFSEKMDFAGLLKEIESAKSRERMLSGKTSDPTPPGAEGRVGETRQIIAQKIGMGKTSYDRARYIVENGNPAQIAALDSGEKKIKTVYNEIKSAEKSVPPPPKPEHKAEKPPCGNSELEELKQSRDEFVSKYAEAKHKQETAETLLHNTEIQWFSEREGKDKYIAELRQKIQRLETENARLREKIKELELKNGT